MDSAVTSSSHFFPELFSNSSFTDKQNSSPTLKAIHIHKNLLANTHASLVFQPPLSAATNAKRNFLSRNGESLVLTFGTKNGFGEEDNRALETVLKLYTAIKQRNVRELSDVIGDECRCVCNFFSYFHSFYGKKQVLEFFKFLLEYLGKNIEFVVRPTLHDGMNVGVSWKLVWDKTHDVPLGKGFSFYMCHVYQGKMVIRNVEMFLEPLVHIEPLQLKIIGFVMSILDKWGWNKEMQSWNKIRSNIKEKRALYLLSTLAVTVVFLFMIGLC
ncbi:hypothetical protein MKX01_019962 [Papaver californicum]|nr:hypothetical protein MKX01_019962 [Papaver californicum]